jgi:hypothetical protein
MMFIMVLWVPIFATLYKRVVLMLWHDLLFLGPRSVGFPPPCSFLLGGSHCLHLQKFCSYVQGDTPLISIMLAKRRQ